MKAIMTRQELRGVIDPEFIGELSQKPINAFQDSTWVRFYRYA